MKVYKVTLGEYPIYTNKKPEHIHSDYLEEMEMSEEEYYHIPMSKHTTNYINSILGIVE